MYSGLCLRLCSITCMDGFGFRFIQITCYHKSLSHIFVQETLFRNLINSVGGMGLSELGCLKEQAFAKSTGHQ